MDSDAPIYVVDANVLIDFQGVGLGIFTQVANHLDDVLVSSQVVIDEVDGLTIKTCEELGIQVVDPAMGHLAFAQQSHGALSFHDLLCFALVRDRGGICVTNDKRLRRYCAERGLEIRWGLRLLIELVEGGFLARKAAIGVAEEVCATNPMLGTEVFERFRDALRTS